MHGGRTENGRFKVAVAVAAHYHDVKILVGIVGQGMVGVPHDEFSLHGKAGSLNSRWKP